AYNWAGRIIDQVESNPKDLVLVIGDMARANPPMSGAFVTEFVRRLQQKHYDFALPISWIEQHLSEVGYTINSIVVSESQKQAADQVSMSNSINSLRFLSKMDWKEFVETMSVVEQTLRQDISGTYPLMDFYTRDKYRHAIENFAKNSTFSETEIAELALNLAKESYEKDPQNLRKAHVGYYLIADGVSILEKRAQVKLDFWKSWHKTKLRKAGILYTSGIVTITFIVTLLLTFKVFGLFSPLATIGIILLFIGVASQTAIALINWYASLSVPPRHLPRMDFVKGIPNDCRSLVVIPTLIVNEEQVDKLLEELEVRYLANKDPNLLFGLLTDFRDAPTAITPGDEDLIRHLKHGIEQLNHKYAADIDEPFVLFHRPRKWNPYDKVWMGYERKRGKLGELNDLLRGRGRDNFSLILGKEEVYATIKYIITLDTDTQLPRDAAWKLVGLMAHPLNQAVYDSQKRIIVDGYGIIQPRLAISLHGATRSLYTKMYEHDAGIDPYTRLISDVYQDLFSEGSYIGKGIYDLDAFEKVTNNRFPENRILSHDLLEGCYTRCGYASDVQLYEDHPSSYSADTLRKHRWIRGDWQVGNWALPFVPNADHKLERNPLNALSRWKIIDNLRRSVMPLLYLV
ncbi:MAG TPA: hypothetical protein VL947_09270, partial [Cytophagales bacterium]|nr:hypothetical protein [Cytophagales bacterium]